MNQITLWQSSVFVLKLLLVRYFKFLICWTVRMRYCSDLLKITADQVTLRKHFFID